MSKRVSDISESNKRQKKDGNIPDPRIAEECYDNESDREIDSVQLNDDYVEGVEPINDTPPISEVQSGSGEHYADSDEEPGNIELNGISDQFI